MGVKKNQKRKPNYTEEEIGFIIDNAETMFFANIGKILGRSKSSIKNVVRRLGISTDVIVTRQGNRSPKMRDSSIKSKICAQCKEDKDFDKFHKSKKGKYGLRSICKDCRAKNAIEYASTHREQIAAYGRKRRKEKKEQISAQRTLHTAANKEELADYQKAWRLANPGKSNARTARRRASKRKATPPCLTKEHWKQIEAFYIEAARLTKETGIPHEVDHIVPLQGKEVRGLHVPWNLRIITRHENRKKSRKFIV